MHPARPAQARGAAPPAVAGCSAPIVFTTDGLPHRQRLDAWNARFETLNAITVPDAAGSTLSVSNENWLLGGMLFSSNRTTRARFERSPVHLRRNEVDHWVIRVLRHGRNHVQHGADSHLLAAGQPFLFSLEGGWVSDWTDAEWISLCLPRDAFPEISAGFAAVGTGPLAMPGAPLLADYLFLLERHLRDAPPDRLPALAEATRAMVAASLLREAAPRGVTPDDIGVARLERVRALIRRHLASPSLNAQRLARLAGMSRTALYRLLEPHGGVATYIQGLRLKRAHALLSDPALAAAPIAALAERAGFFDASAFSRTFRAAFGYPPRDARAAAQAGLLLPGRDPLRSGALADHEFGLMLQRIGTPAGASANEA